jgi:TRAP-type C4-dicarboxylate transport system substrate-binding protein
MARSRLCSASTAADECGSTPAARKPAADCTTTRGGSRGTTCSSVGTGQMRDCRRRPAARESACPASGCPGSGRAGGNTGGAGPILALILPVHHPALSRSDHETQTRPAPAGRCRPGAFAQTKWDLPAAYPATNFHTENLTQFANDVDKASGGKLKIQVHANASLFKANEIKRAVQSGQAPIGEVLLVNFENENPVYGADGIPFLAASYATRRSWRGAEAGAGQAAGAQGMKLLYTVAWPPQGIYVNKDHRVGGRHARPEVARLQPATAKIAELIGAQPVTIQAAELSQALATGVVNSYMSSGSTGYDSKTYESIKYWYDTQAWLPKNAIIVNQKAFDALTSPRRKPCSRPPADAEKRGWAAAEEKNEWYKKALASKGMKIMKPVAKLLADMKQVGCDHAGRTG